MTHCPIGWHPFPIEDSTGAYCEEHGITLLWQPEPTQGEAPPVTAPPEKGQK
ncbi:hypothetical protein AB0I93_14215 [Streptomyces sp. NPDC049967]|uniref:hypothetical protein n=1 Tax=Streptomyces sp. NPDC049967 TaxID=3155658 RepID=UPI003441200A